MECLHIFLSASFAIIGTTLEIMWETSLANYNWGAVTKKVLNYTFLARSWKMVEVETLNQKIGPNNQ